ncbi:hypothetical protein GCM10009583_13280 [Ornithinicoccus hortensis]|uniref:GDSL-like lipase/acylhydrolase family protein n=1 Tax=Ornithinicoccus hortensis TaxID=82346 RepID=A0A542YRV5_9MICO|nr:GDSL-like lipase/acylhydrolase family protein [Ornithinicoccus hortensis]
MLEGVDIRRRTSLTALTSIPAGLALALTGVVPAQADDTAYVALGDSFSAGTGTRNSTDDCYRSPYGYPALIAGAQGLTLDYQACSGATTADVLANQVGSLGPDTGLVTMTIGGNDLGFADVITECAQPGWLSDCAGAIAGGRAILQNELPGRYDAVLGAIAAAAPAADVRIGGYPHLFNGEDCNAATFFSPEEMADLNAATDELDALVEQKTLGAGYTFVDPRDAFDGHAVCDDVEWVNGLSWPIVESFHPNRDGNIGYADEFWPGSGSAAAATVPADRTAQGVEASVRQEADAVLAMDLASPANLRAAQAAGISPDRITGLVEQLRSADTDVVAGALAELSALDEQHDQRVVAYRG